MINKNFRKNKFSFIKKHKKCSQAIILLTMLIIQIIMLVLYFTGTAGGINFCVFNIIFSFIFLAASLQNAWFWIELGILLTCFLEKRRTNK